MSRAAIYITRHLLRRTLARHNRGSKPLFVQIMFLSGLVFIASPALSQSETEFLIKGNEAYRSGDFAEAINNYKQALLLQPDNDAARFNYANALQQQKQGSLAADEYEKIISKKSSNIKPAAFYNLALADIQEQKLLPAISRFKEALKLNPLDTEARENLQLALNQLKRNTQQKEENKQNNQKKAPPPPQPKANKQLMDQKFSELRNQEKQLQKKLQKKQAGGQPEKDW